MELYLMIMVIVAMLALVGVVFGILNSGSVNNLLTRVNDVGQIALNTEHNVSAFKNTTTNSINISISMASNKSINTIATVLMNTSSLIANTLKAQNVNAINETKNVTEGISTVVNNQDTELAYVTSINSSIKDLPDVINSSVNNAIGKALNSITLSTSNSSLNTVVLWTMDQSVPAGSYIVYGIPDTFDAHIKVNSSTAVTASIMTVWQFANFSKGTSTSSIESFGSVGDGNEININFTTSEGCSLYDLVITSTTGNVAFTVYPNVTGTYMPTASLQGICT